MDLVCPLRVPEPPLCRRPEPHYSPGPGGRGLSCRWENNPPTLRRGHLWEQEHRAPRDGRFCTSRQGGPGLGLLLLFV